MESLPVSGSSYIIGRNPEKFGGQQADFLARSERTLEEAHHLIINSVAEGKDLTALFFAVLGVLAISRQETAIAHRHKYPLLFGNRRDRDERCEESIYATRLIGPCTFLDGEYTEFNKKFMDQLAPIIEAFPHTKEKFHKTTHTFETRALGRLNRFTVEVLNEEKINSIATLPSLEELNTTVENSESSTIGEFIKNRDLMVSLKERNPDFYKRLKMGHFIKALMDRFPRTEEGPPLSRYLDSIRHKPYLKSLYVLATNRLEIDGKLVSLSQYVTWMFCDLENDPVDRMKICSTVQIIHQDTFLVQKTLEDIAKIFHDCITSNVKETGLPELKNKIALLRYEFAHCMPFQRGSAAIGEWLEKAIYRYHGFEATHSAETMGDCEALTATSLGQFLEAYPRTVTVRPL